MSGTPVLTTRIPGIPQDYYPFLYLFDEEDVESMSDRIRDVLSLDAVLLKNKGEEAYRYVAMNKNCRVQAEKIYHFVRKL